MKLLRRHEPDVPLLLDEEDLDGLSEAARFEDPRRNFEGEVTDRGAPVREQAVLALGELSPEAGNGTVAAALRDPFDRVRSAAVRVLYMREQVIPLAEALSWLPADASARKLALQAIFELRSTSAARVVARALVHSAGDEPLSDADSAFLHTLAQPERRRRPMKGVIRELLTALSDDRAEVGDRAQELLVRFAPASTAGVINELQRGGCPERAAAVLGRIGDNRALGPLIEALGHRQAEVRVRAAAALGELRDPTAVESLLRVTRDSHPDVRAEASYALDRMGTAAVVVGMSALLRPMVAQAVASATELQAPAAERVERPQLEAPSGLDRFAQALEHARAADEPPR